MRSILRDKIMSKYLLYDGEILKIQDIKDIIRCENINLRDLVYLLGLYKGVIYKENARYSRININKYSSIKDSVKLILLDLKYLNEYGNKSYSKFEIINICNKYNVDFYDFLKYARGYKFCYRDNLEIVQKNDIGLWLGNNPCLSNEFIIDNYYLLEDGLNKVCNNFIFKHGCYNKRDDLYLVGKEAILRNGQIERNFKFDKKRIFSKLFFRAKYAMLDYLIDSYKYTSYEDNVIIIEENDLDIDFEYQVEYNLLTNIKFDTLESIVIDELILNLEESIYNRDRIIKNIGKKLEITLELINEIINKIQYKIIYAQNVRLCKDGKVVLKIEC